HRARDLGVLRALRLVALVREQHVFGVAHLAAVVDELDMRRVFLPAFLPSKFHATGPLFDLSSLFSTTFFLSSSTVTRTFAFIASGARSRNPTTVAPFSKRVPTSSR